MNTSQQLNHIQDNNYDDDIRVTDVPNHYFLAVTSNFIAEGADTREITVDMLPLEQSSGGTMAVNTGVYLRRFEEKAVKVTVKQEGKEVATNTTNY